jgi:hypothetical protein
MLCNIIHHNLEQKREKGETIDKFSISYVQTIAKLLSKNGPEPDFSYLKR